MSTKAQDFAVDNVGAVAFALALAFSLGADGGSGGFLAISWSVSTTLSAAAGDEVCLANAFPAVAGDGARTLRVSVPRTIGPCLDSSDCTATGSCGLGAEVPLLKLEARLATLPALAARDVVLAVCGGYVIVSS